MLQPTKTRVTYTKMLPSGIVTKYCRTTCRFSRIAGLREQLDTVLLPDLADIVIGFLFTAVQKRTTVSPDISVHSKFAIRTIRCSRLVNETKDYYIKLIPLFYCYAFQEAPCQFVCYAVWHKDFAFIPLPFTLVDELGRHSLCCSFGPGVFGEITSTYVSEVEALVQQGEPGLRVWREVDKWMRDKGPDGSLHDDVGKLTERLGSLNKPTAISLYKHKTRFASLFMARS
jgi:hypothetical protein